MDKCSPTNPADNTLFSCLGSAYKTVYFNGIIYNKGEQILAGSYV